MRLVSDLPLIGAAVEPRTLHLLLQQLHRLGVALAAATRVTSLADGAVTLRNLFTTDVSTAPAGTVVLAHSRRSDPAVALGLDAVPIPSYIIGDALAPRRLTHAVLEGGRFGVAM